MIAGRLLRVGFVLLIFISTRVASQGEEANSAVLAGLFFGRAPDPAKSRGYFIAAEPVLWDYAPSGKDEVCGNPLPLALLGGERKAVKLRYVQYTDATFTSRVIENPSLGILGPILRGVVGDFIVVTFLNRTGQPLSLHPHGVKYDKDSEGSWSKTGAGKGAAVAPDAKFTYIWQLDEASGPLPGEPSSKAWLYHSHVTGDDEINEGLIGAIIVTDPKRARADGTPSDVDRELATLFLIFDESGLGAEAREAYEYVDNGSGIPKKSWAEIQEILEVGSRATINGRVFGNLPGLEMNEGERVRWYVFGLGSERDFHTAHWHGQRVIEEGRRRTDVVELLPGSMKVADFVADNPGTWMFHCHVADHMREGMFAQMVVHAHGANREADRSPEKAFLGLPAAARSMYFQRAVALLDPAAGGAAASSTVRLRGMVSVFDAFSVFNQTVKIQVGGKSIVFRPDQTGRANAADGAFEIKNANQTGVVYGGLMEFEAVLRGSEWLKELKKLGWSPDSSDVRKKELPMIMELGAVQHRTVVSIDARTVGR